METTLPVAEFWRDILHKVKKSTGSICTCEQWINGTTIS